MSDATPTNSALDEPWARAIVRRSRRSGWRCLGIGLVLFVVVGTFANVFVGGSQRLRDEGQATQGTIVGRTSAALKDGTAKVDYVVNDRHHQRAVALGNKAGRYSVGQQVTVYYDSDDPDKITIDDIDNEPAWTVLPMALGFVASITLLVAGVVILIRSRRTRRLLRASTWQDQVRVVGSRGTALFLTLPEDRLLRAVPVDAGSADAASRVRVAGEDDRFLVALGEEPSTLIRARRPRGAAQDEKWRKLIAGPAPTA